MKKYIFSIIALFALKSSIGQTMQASIGAGASLNNIIIYLRPSGIAAGPANYGISTLQFNVAIPSTITPAPTLSLVSNNIAGVTWIIDPPLSEGGYWNYNIYNAQAGYNLSLSNNVELQAMEVAFSGGPSGTFANTAHLVTLPDGGALGSNQSLFYCTGAINSNGQSLYYARDANVTVANGDSYSPPPFPGSPSPLGTFTSFARFNPGVVLPVKFTSFTAVKVNDNGRLNWTVEGETAVTDHYEVERSFSGLDFVKIATVAAKNNGQANNAYEMTDLNLSSLKSSGVIYYRVKQVDKDGKFTYTQIRNLRLEGKAFVIGVYPNPVKDITKVNLDMVEATDIVISITDAAGKEVQKVLYKAPKGQSLKKVDMSGLVGGTYLLKIAAGEDVKTVPVVKTN